MKIEYRKPPNYEQIKMYFPSIDFDKGTVFTYGDTCYTKLDLSPDLYVHEETHTKQQSNPGEWWNNYLNDSEFRLSQELEAYTEQYKWIKKNVRDRNLRFRLRDKILRDLSGDMYGRMITFSEAEKIIKL